MDHHPRHLWSWSISVQRQCHEVQALVIDYTSKKALLRREGRRWVLPGFWVDFDDDEIIGQPSAIAAIVEKLTAISTKLAFLRHLWTSEKTTRIDDSTCTLEKHVVLLETIGLPHLGIHDFEWRSSDCADVYHLFEDATRAVREAIRQVSTGCHGPRLPAWQRPGWLRFAMNWMEKVLHEQCNGQLTDGVFFECSSSYGVVLRAQTEKGRFFLKCTSALANDAAYTGALSEIVPRFVAKPIAVDRERQMMVTADYGEISIVGRLSKEEENRISRDYARLQKGTIDKIDELIEAGFPDLRPLKLLDYIDKLPHDSAFQALGDAEESAPFVSFFCDNREKVKKALKKLIESDIPATVTHNDLAFTNMYKPSDTDNYMFFDWVEGFVGHPFTSSPLGIRQEPYLEEWKRDYDMSLEELRTLLDLGGCFYSLTTVILRLREASASEPIDAKKCLEEVGSALQVLKYDFSRL